MGPLEAEAAPGERRSRSPGALAAAVLSVSVAACVVGAVIHPVLPAPGVLVALSPPVVYTAASKLQDYSIQIPASWKPGTKLGVKVRLHAYRCPGARHIILRTYTHLQRGVPPAGAWRRPGARRLQPLVSPR